MSSDQPVRQPEETSETQVKMGRNNHITLISPYGRDTIAPDSSFLQDLIMNSGDEYWQAASGSAALEFHREDGKGAQLILMEDERAGFFLLYEDPETGAYFHPAGQEESDQVVTIYVGGEPMEINARDFISKDKAWEAVDYFIRQGERAPGFNWQIWL